MNVYVVFKVFYREESFQVVGVYSTQARARKVADSIERHNGLYNAWVKSYKVRGSV